MHWYFAFGANCNAHVLASRRIVSYAQRSARLPSFDLAFLRAGYVDCEPRYADILPHDDTDANSECQAFILRQVHGVLHQVDDAGLAELDAFEGAGVTYERVRVEAQAYVDATVSAWAYQGYAHSRARPSLPSGRYSAVLTSGWVHAGLPAAQARALGRIPVLDNIALGLRLGTIGGLAQPQRWSQLEQRYSGLRYALRSEVVSLPTWLNTAWRASGHRTVLAPPWLICSVLATAPSPCADPESGHVDASLSCPAGLVTAARAARGRLQELLPSETSQGRVDGPTPKRVAIGGYIFDISNSSSVSLGKLAGQDMTMFLLGLLAAADNERDAVAACFDEHRGAASRGAATASGASEPSAEHGDPDTAGCTAAAQLQARIETGRCSVPVDSVESCQPDSSASMPETGEAVGQLLAQCSTRQKAFMGAWLVFCAQRFPCVGVAVDVLEAAYGVDAAEALLA